MEVSSIFSAVVTREEWAVIPLSVAEKLEVFTSSKIEELLTSKALLETNRFNTEKSKVEFKSQLETLTKENDELKVRQAAATSNITELESQMSQITGDLIKLQAKCNVLDSEAADFRRQRNMAIDERDEHLKMLQRRTNEVERLQTDVNALTKQLESAISAKCVALAQADGVESLKLRLEYREKRLEQERQLQISQIETLTEDLNARTEELLNMRRDNTSRCIQLETKLTEKTQELVVANEQIKSLTEINDNCTVRCEELAEKLLNQRETDAKMNESYLHEIEAKTKLANAYKAMIDENAQHMQQLKDALTEVQEMLRHATEEYGELETKHKETELSHDELIAKKNECITMLKKELELAKDLSSSDTPTGSSKYEQLHKDLEGLSPTAASRHQLLRPGTTVTDLYAQYVANSERLIDMEKDNTQLKNYIASIVQEVEEKGPLIKKLREDYSNALDDNELLKNSNDELVLEIQQLRESHLESSRLEGAIARENARYKKEVADLSRQVCHLLQEVENSRVGSSSSSLDLSDSVSSADIITKKLVTFNDIAELQRTNQKLLAVVRELTERAEEAEETDPAAVAELKRAMHALRDEHADLLNERDKQHKMMTTVINQRDMYKNLYSQAVKAAGQELDETNDVRMETEPQQAHKTHLDELYTKQIAELKAKIAEIQNEHEVYVKEKTTNEKIALEQLDTSRLENKELVKSNSRLVAQIENVEEKFKVSQNNVEIYKKQIAALEQQNKIYSESCIKHEQSMQYLKETTLEAQTKLTTAEVTLANLQKENALLRDAENRWIKENDTTKRQSHAQNMIQTNLELIKATLERADAEGKLRLEARLDEAHRECAALRRRLQEEQDRFRELTEHLKKQAENAEQRYEEEKGAAAKLRVELGEARQSLAEKHTQIDSLTKKIKTNVFTLPEARNSEARVIELEQEYANAKSEAVALEAKLKTAKEAAEQYYNVSQAAEAELKVILDEKAKLQAESDKQRELVTKLEEKCAELESELSIQMDDKDIEQASKRFKASTSLEDELNTRNMDLKTAREQLDVARNDIKTLNEALKAVENKYSREVYLHSADLQLLNDLKTQLDVVRTDLNEVRQAKNGAIEMLEAQKQSWEEREQFLDKERKSVEQRFKDAETQNELLLNQLEQLHTQLNLLGAQATSNDANITLNSSTNEDDSELLTIIKFLRKEKDIAVSKAEIIEAEHDRLKSQFESLNKQLKEAQAQAESGRQSSEVSMVSATKHLEVLRKVETLNAITDSNRGLRQERDALRTEIGELRTQVEQLSHELAPIRDKNRELTIKAEAMQTENITLRGDCTRWRQRAQMLIEKSNRTSPEDWKKLQNERETLAKQVTIERGNVAKLNDELATVKSDKGKLEEQLKQVRQQCNGQAEELARIRDVMAGLQAQFGAVNQNLEQTQESYKKILEENRLLTEDTAGKDVNITELKNNLMQIRKIAKKYKIQCEDQIKEIRTLKDENEAKETERNAQNVERSGQEEKIVQLEQSLKETNENFAQQVEVLTAANESHKKEIETLKNGASDREEKYKVLFKNAKERIVNLIEQNQALKRDDAGETSTEAAKIDALEKEKAAILASNEKYTAEIEALVQKVNQLQRQLAGQQGLPKPSTSTREEKPASEPPTANIKPMAGHSTNTQTQSVPIHPWRSAGETPLASIRPMSAQLRTVTVLPTSQTPSAVMVPPQQQAVHTTASSGGEAASSSPTSSHTEYVPATSSAMLAARGAVAAVPQQSEEADESAQMPATAPVQAVALVLPRVEQPGATQEQGTSSSSSSNTVTTTQAGLKRQRDDSDQVGGGSGGGDNQAQKMQVAKRTRVQAGGVSSDSGLDVEYQVPTSSQRDHDDDNVIVVESDEEGGADEGEGVDDEGDDPEGYDMEVMEQQDYDDGDCQDEDEEEDDEEEAGNEVEVIEDSSEIPVGEGGEAREGEHGQPEATSSGTDGGSGGVTLSQASPSVSMTMSSFSRTRSVAPLPSRQQQQQQQQQQSNLLLAHGLVDECGGDDGIVPSTPTLFVPRRSDGFGEAVSSPHVPTSAGRFTFNDTVLLQPNSASGSSEVVPDHSLEVANMDENSTGRSVPSTPLQTSPQEPVPGSDEQAMQVIQSEVEIPMITVSTADEDEPRAEGSSSGEERMGPPGQAGPSSADDLQLQNQAEDMEGYDGVSSEGEKPPSTEEGEEEGREAEASPSTNTRSSARISRGSTAARRSMRQVTSRGGMSRAGPPTPIVWGAEHPHPRSMMMQRHSDGPIGRGRGNNPQSSYPMRATRRPRGRAPRPYGRF